MNNKILSRSKRALALTSQVFQSSRTFWNKVISEKNNFPEINLGSLRLKEEGKLEMQQKLPADIAHKINSVAKNEPNNVFALFVALMAILINKYTNVNHASMGLLIDDINLKYAPVDCILRINSTFTGEDTFRSFLAKTSKTIRETYIHKDFPSDLLEMSQCPGCEEGRNINIVLASTSIHPPELLKEVKTNLIFSVIQEGIDIAVKVVFDKKMYSEAVINNLLERFVIIAKKLLDKPDDKILNIHLLTKNETNFFLNQVNATDKVFKHETALALWEDTCLAFPESTVGADCYNEYSYHLLNELSTMMAAHLQSKGVKQGSRVALILPASVDILICIIACFKCGAAFIPIDPEAPNERVKVILEDCNYPLVITNAEINVSNDIDALDIKKLLLPAPQIYCPVQVTPQDEAYIIYTSGSTGLPKGVVIQHSSLSNYVQWFIERISLNAKDSSILTSSYTFDLGYTTLFPTIFSGGTVHFLPKKLYLNPEYLLNYINKKGITYLKVTPSFLRIIILDNSFDLPKISSIRLIVCGGEAIDSESINYLFELRKDTITVMNHYGPTETTIGIVHEVITYGTFSKFMEKPVIGSPIDNIKAYVLDSNFNLSAPGVPGKLYVSGSGLFKEYLNDPSKTAEKLIKSPFNYDETLYDTGDIVTWSAKGKIDFIGRKDSQIKMYGYRVDLKEIEHVMSKHSNIIEAHVIMTKNEQELITLNGFYTANKNLGEDELRDFLSRFLPSYMVPVNLIQRHEFKLTGNGKTDLSDLRDLVTKSIQELHGRKSIKEIWASVLKLPIQDAQFNSNFFDQGGHSIVALELIANIWKYAKKRISLYDLYNHSTLGDLISHIDDLQEEHFIHIPVAPIQESYSASPQQQQMYTLQRLDPYTTAYNKPYIIKIKGLLDLNKLQTAFDKLIARHECLRTTFFLDGNQVRQKVHEKTEFKIGIMNSRGMIIEILANSLVRPFNLNKLPLIRSTLIIESGIEHSLFIDLHHITSDAVSMTIFITELISFYNNAILAPIAISYKDYAEWLQTNEFKEQLELQKTFWNNEFYDDEPFILQATVCKPDQANTIASNHYIEIPTSLTSEIKKIALAENVTPFSFLLACFNILLHEFTGQENIIIGTSVEGRPHPDTKYIFGNFINTVAIKNRIKQSDSFGHFLQNVSAKMLNILSNQNYPFNQLITEMRQNQGLQTNQIFNVFFEVVNSTANLLVMDGFDIQVQESNFGNAKFDLAYYVEDKGNSMKINVEYKSSIFDRHFIEKLSERYHALLQLVVNDLQITIEGIKLT